MLSALITSSARRKLLVRFLTHPEERFYPTQLMRELSLSSSLVQKELARLSATGLLRSEREGNTRFYSVDTTHPLYAELKSIVYKTEGLGDLLQERISPLEDVSVALIYGSVARNTEDARSDVDLLVIGDVSPPVLDEALMEAEGLLGREINATLLDIKEWHERVARKQAFAMDILRQPKVFLIGAEDDLR
ncbi:MAG: nucleotidyltransferase domain-containing protein [Anaerosomatales bacterium]|nr:nucleotidyltransferase domain-containing protein [Anaerosomatales bacterium]